MRLAVMLVIAGTIACTGGRERRVVATIAGDDPEVATRVVVPAEPVSKAPVVQLAAGPAHVCARHADGALSCWGDNAAGQLGDRATGERDVPYLAKLRARPVGGPMTGVLAISTSATQTCALRDDGVWCWGGADRAPVRIGATENDAVELAGPCLRRATGEVRCWAGLLAADPLPWVETAIDLAAYGDTVCALGMKAEVSCNYYDESSGVWFEDSAAQIEGAVEVSVGGDGIRCVRTSAGKVQCWYSRRIRYAGETRANEPYVVGGIDEAAQVVAGASFACERETTGEVRCWDQFPQPPGAVAIERAVPIGGVSADELVAGERFVCARRGSDVACWGDNGRGQLGNGRSAIQPVPREVPGLTDAVDVEVAGGMTCARRRGGSTTCWGPIYGSTVLPTDSISYQGAIALTGNDGMCARFDDGTVRCGRGGRVAPIYLRDAAMVAGGMEAGLVVRRDGTLYRWRDPRTAYDGGYEVATVAEAPLIVDGPVAAIGVGRGGMCVIAGGRVRCTNAYTQLHHPSYRGEDDLGPVRGVDGATAVVVADEHACAIVAGGVRCWGTQNETGVLGLERRPQPGVAVTIGGLDDVAQVATQLRTACARRTDGSVWCWGDNATGLLGDPLVRARSAVPVKVAIEPVIDLAVSTHACAVTADGRVLCWGATEEAQTGTLPEGSVFPPTRVEW
jgi:alpha-tubulin suppressor-like RCC1 family protein